MKKHMACVVAALAAGFGCASNDRDAGDPSGNGGSSTDGKGDSPSGGSERLLGAWERKGTEGPYVRMVFMSSDPRYANLEREGFRRYFADRDPTSHPFEGQAMTYLCTGANCPDQREDGGFKVEGATLRLRWELISDVCSGCLTGDDLEFAVNRDELTLSFEGNEVERLVRVPHTCSAPIDCETEIVECRKNNTCADWGLEDSARTMAERRWTCNEERRCEFTAGQLCSAHSDCGFDEYCQRLKDFEVCLEGSGGSCVPRPTGCPQTTEIDRRACGCELGGDVMSECEVMALGDNPVDCQI